jgi:hypothetical protein
MRLIAFIFIAITAISCEFKTEVKTGSSGETKIRNGIELKANGVKISQAFLLYEDGTLVNEDNVVGVNQRVDLRLIVDEGFQVREGKHSIGISEKIETNTREVVLDERDLFADSAPVEARQPQLLTISAIITRIDKLYDYFLVSFRVWDKYGMGQVSGSYKLYIK